MTSFSRRKSFGPRRNDGAGGNGPPPFSAYDAACRDRWVNVSKNMMGERAEIAMSCGTVYEGVIHVIAPVGGSRGVYKVVMRSAMAKSSGDRASSSVKIDRQEATLVLAGEDIVSMTVKRFPLQQNGAQRPMGLGTDAVIGSRTAGGTGLRSLKKVDSSWVSGPEDLSLKDNAGKWDQFEANERLFNVTSTFDENLYTTRLDKSSLTKQQVADAERLAAEISSKSSSNIHMREERNMMTKMDDRMGEEERFGGVLGTGGLAQTTLNNGGGGSGLRHSSPRDRGVPSSMTSSAGKTNSAGSGTGVYVPPALRPPNAPVPASGAGTMASNSPGAVNGRRMPLTAADARLEDAKAALMDVLDGKHRSTPPLKSDNRPKPEAASSDTPIPEKTPAPSPSPKKALPVAEAAAVSTPLVGGSDVPASSAAGSTKKTVSSNAPPFVPATTSTQASAVTSHPPVAAARVTKTGGGGAKKKSSLRASAKEWKPNPAAPEWKPAAAGAGARTSVGLAAAAPVAIPLHAPAPMQAHVHQQAPSPTKVQAQAPTQAPAASMMTPSPRGGGDSGLGTGGRGVISGGSMGFSGGVEHGGDYGHVPHMPQHRSHPQQHHNPYVHHAAGGLHQQQKQKQQTSPHPSRQSSPHASPHSSRHRQGHFFQQQQQQPRPQHGSPQQGSPQQHSAQQQQQPPQQQQQPQQQQHPPAAGSPATQMVMPPYPPGSMPATGAVGSGGIGPPHMAGVPPHPMMGLPPQPLYRTPMGHHPQQMFMQPPPAGMRMPMAPGQLQGYPQQGMPMMAQPGAPVAPPGAPFYHGNMQPPQQQQQQQQQQQSQMQLPPSQIPAQQGQPPPRGFMIQGHPGAGPAPGQPYTPPQPQRPGGVAGVMGMGGGVNGGGGNSPHEHGGDMAQGNDVFGGHSRRGRGGGRGVRGSGLSRQNSASRKHRGGSTS